MAAKREGSRLESRGRNQREGSRTDVMARKYTFTRALKQHVVDQGSTYNLIASRGCRGSPSKATAVAEDSANCDEREPMTCKASQSGGAPSRCQKGHASNLGIASQKGQKVRVPQHCSSMSASIPYVENRAKAKSPPPRHGIQGANSRPRVSTQLTIVKMRYQKVALTPAYARQRMSNASTEASKTVDGANTTNITFI
ncbi:hypothetical protein KEM55_008591 [Ascosphaera atra]|nr:hypothetical protein KEM55_008591 [Ascosphaera atra]